MAESANHPSTDLIRRTRDGSWRVAGTRVSVDSIVHEFRGGATPEQIVQDFAGVTLAEVYGVVHYYLTHRRAVSAYLKTQEQLDRKLRRELGTEHRAFLSDLRKRIAARRRAGNRAA